MRLPSVPRARQVGLAALLLTSLGDVQSGSPATPALPAEMQAIKEQLAEQRRLIDAMAREMRALRELQAQQQPPAPAPAPAPASTRHEAAPGAAAPAFADVAATASPAALALERGTGNLDDRGEAAGAGAAQPGNGTRAAPAGPAPAGPAPAGPAPAGSARAGAASADSAPTASRSVGTPPPSRRRPPEVAPLFEQPGVLTQPGSFVFEPSLQFSYSSSNRVALVGYTIIPALLVGLVDVREIKRNTTTFALTGRVGLTNRIELEVKAPYVYRSDATVSREVFTGSAQEKVFDTSGKALGDAELALRYQLNNGGADSAYYIGGLRVKSRTGRDPFTVVTDCVRRCVGDNVTGTGLPLDLPTGSGFYSIQPSLTWLFPSDPAVFFGSVSYLHNVKRRDVSRTVLGGEKEFLGEVAPGAIIGFNFGMGLALNDKASLSLGYDHSSIGRTYQNGEPAPGSVRTQLGSLLLGFSYRVSPRRTLNVSVGAGLTRDTPDMSLTVRVPITF